MAMEQTYLMVKPDGVQRGLCGEILSRFEKKGLKIVAVKLMVIPQETAEQHYGEHKGKPFFLQKAKPLCKSPFPGRNANTFHIGQTPLCPAIRHLRLRNTGAAAENQL